MSESNAEFGVGGVKGSCVGWVGLGPTLWRSSELERTQAWSGGGIEEYLTWSLAFEFEDEVKKLRHCVFGG